MGEKRSLENNRKISPLPSLRHEQKKVWYFFQRLKISRGWTNLQNVNVQIAANFHIKQVRILHSERHSFHYYARAQRTVKNAPNQIHHSWEFFPPRSGPAGLEGDQSCFLPHFHDNLGRRIWQKKPSWEILKYSHQIRFRLDSRKVVNSLSVDL